MKKTKVKTPEPEVTTVRGPLHPLTKLALLDRPFSFRVAQVTDEGVWTSAVVFEGDRVAVCKNVAAGYLSGRARWAEDLDGQILWGIDPSGNRCDGPLTKNLESIREWQRANVGAYSS